MNLLKIMSPYINPAGVFVLLVFGLAFLMFFGISKRNGIKIFAFAFVAIIFLAAIFIHISGYRTGGYFANDFFISGLTEVIETVVVLFFSLVCITVLFIYNRKNDHFITVMMIFIFLAMSLLLLIISKNFTAFFTSLASFLIAFFAMSTVLNNSTSPAGDESGSGQAIIFSQPKASASAARFFIASLFFLVLLFFGFSILYGISDVKNFAALYQNIESGGINIILSLIIISIAFYIYLGIFPFQAPYISFANNSEPSSVYLLWLFYFPAGIVALFKFVPIISILNKNLKAGAYILYLLMATVLISSVGSGMAVLRTKSLKKASSYFFSLVITGYFINMVLLIAGFIKEDRLYWLNIFYLLFIAVSFLPIAFIFSYIAKIFKKDSLGSLISIIYRDKIAGIVLLISLFSLAGVPGLFGFIVNKYYFNVIISIFSEGIKGLSGAQAWFIFLILIVYFAAFTAACLRFIITIFKKQDRYIQPEINFKGRKSFYALICFFAVLVIFLGVLGLLETLNPSSSFFGIRITDSAVFINNLK